MHPRLHYGTRNSAVEDERVPPVLQDNGTGEVLPVTKIENESKNAVPKPRDPNEEVFTYSSIEEARAHGLSLGSSFKGKTSKMDTNWRYSCKELNCPAKWSIVEKKYTYGSSFFLRINQHHTHLPDVKTDQYGVFGKNTIEDYFSCDFNWCSFKTKTTKGLKDHKESHKAKGPSKTWACRWCDYTTTASQYILTLHVNSVHLNFKPHKCDFCDFAGLSKTAVTYHMERKHKKEGFKPRDPNEEVFTYPSIEEARAHGLSLGSSFMAKTSKMDTNWRYSCKELNCPAKWSIMEKKYTDRSSSFFLRINQHHTHLPDVKTDHNQDGVLGFKHRCDQCDFTAQGRGKVQFLTNNF